MPPPRTPRPRMPAEAQHAQRAVAFGAADQAGDLGRADVEHAERAGAARPRGRGGLAPGRHGGGRMRRGHIVHVGLSPASVCPMRAASGAASVVADPACGRITSRSGSRMSTPAAAGRAARASCCSCCKPVERRDLVRLPAASRRRRCSAAGSSAARRRARRRRRAPARPGRAVSASSSAAAAPGAPAPTTSGRLAELRDVLIGHDLAVAVDQHEFALVLPDRERPALLQLHHDRAGQPALDRRVLAPRRAFRSARAPRPARSPGSDRRCETPSAARSSGSGVLARPSMTMSLDAQPGRGGRCAEPLAQRREPAAGLRRVHAARSRAADDQRSDDRVQPAGRSSRRWRRSSSFQPAGPVVDRVARAASLTRGMRPSPPSRRTAAGSRCRRCAACSGSSEVGVRPGCVLISSSTSRPGSPSVSS